MTTPEKLRRLADRLSAQNPVAAMELRGAADDIEATIEQGRTEVVDVETTLAFVERMMKALRTVMATVEGAKKRAPR